MPPKKLKNSSKSSEKLANSCQPVVGSSASTLQLEDKKGQFTCPICDDVITDAGGSKCGQDSVECSGTCSTWLHKHCAGLSKTAFNKVCKSDQPFFCPQCRLDKQAFEIACLKDQVSKLSSELTDVCSRLNDLQGLLPVSMSVSTKETDSSTSSQLKCGLVTLNSATPAAPLVHTSVPGQSTSRQNAAKTREDYNSHSQTFQRKFNLVIFGLQESEKGTKKHLRNRQDIKAAGELLSWLDPVVTTSLITDSVRLGRYSEKNTRPLLVKLTRSNDVQSILMARKKLATRPNITIKPDMTAEDRRIESLLLKERRSLIDAGTKRSDIKIQGNEILVRKKRHGAIIEGTFQQCSLPPVHDDQPETPKSASIPSSSLVPTSDLDNSNISVVPTVSLQSLPSFNTVSYAASLDSNAAVEESLPKNNHTSAANCADSSNYSKVLP